MCDDDASDEVNASGLLETKYVQTDSKTVILIE